MEAYTSPALEETTPYYLYAKCSKTTEDGTFLLSTTAISLDQDADYYHFLVGILSSEFEGARSFTALYGFTEILPGRITVDKIVSPDGTSYYDVLNGLFSGKFTFKAGSSGYDNITDAPDVDALLSDFQEYIDGAFADGIISEAEAASIATYINNINTTKAAVEAQYNKLYANSFLSGTPKTGLYNAKAALFVAINDLITAVETAIEDGQTTALEKADVDAKFVLYSTALATYNTAVETANKAIQDAINATATNAANTASTANNKATSALSTAEAASNAANAAASTANAASTAAGNAATAAAGKAKVFYATSAPTSGMQTNDLWVNGTDIYRYSGSAWVLASAYDVTLTQINGGLITTGAISFGQTGGMAASGTLRIWAGGTGGANGAPPTTPTFRVYADGSVYARNSVIVENSNGVVQAGISSYGTATESVRIWSGAASPDSGTFRVMANGNVYANWATVTNLYGNIIDLRDPNNVNNYTWLWGNKGAPGLTIKRTEEANTNPVNGINIDYGMSSTVARSISFHFRRFSNEASWFFRTCIKASKLPSVTQINALSGTGSTRWNLKWDEASGYIYIE